MLSLALRSLILAILVFTGGTEATSAQPSFGELLGWKKNEVVVILHVDDVGMSHSSNQGAIQSTEKGVASSFAIMMPCPWVPEIARYLTDHPDADSGLHLTLTSEWRLYRWPPLAGPTVPGLIDPEGCLWSSVAQVVTQATPDEIDREIRAQLARARKLNIPVTHLDSHMGTLFARPDYFQKYAQLGIEEQIPILVAGGHLTYTKLESPGAAQQLMKWIPKIWDGGLPVIDDLHTSTYNWSPEEKEGKLIELLQNLKPGITEILFHASDPSDVFPLITGSSESRRADLNALLSKKVSRTIQENNIVVTTWKELMKRRQALGDSKLETLQKAHNTPNR